MKRNLLVIFLIVCLLACTTGGVYAWIIYSQRSITVYTGQVKINVSGYYDIINDEDTPEYDTALTSLNNFNDLAANDMIALKFVVTNQSDYPTVLSIAFSDFFESAISEFMTFHSFCETYYSSNNALPEVSAYNSSFVTAMTALTEKNTAKLTLVIENASYVTQGGVATQIADADRYLWQYATGNSFLSNIPISAGEYVTVYFTLRNMQSSEFIRSYEEWLCGDGVTPSYAQELCANLLDSDYASLSANNKAIVNAYLGYFFDKELEAANPGESEFSILKWEIKYFEFIGESTVTE